MTDPAHSPHHNDDEHEPTEPPGPSPIGEQEEQEQKENNKNKKSVQDVIVCGLSWDEVQNKNADLDLSAIVLDSDNEIIGRVFWGQMSYHNGSINHSGDETTGEKSGDDETISVELKKLPKNADRIFFLLSNYNNDSAGEEQQNSSATSASSSSSSLTKTHNISARVLQKKEADDLTGKTLLQIQSFHDFQQASSTSSSSPNTEVFCSLQRSSTHEWFLSEMSFLLRAESLLDPNLRENIPRIVEASEQNSSASSASSSSSASAAATTTKTETKKEEDSSSSSSTAEMRQRPSSKQEQQQTNSNNSKTTKNESNKADLLPNNNNSNNNSNDAANMNNMNAIYLLLALIIFLLPVILSFR